MTWTKPLCFTFPVLKSITLMEGFQRQLQSWWVWSAGCAESAGSTTAQLGTSSLKCTYKKTVFERLPLYFQKV